MKVTKIIALLQGVLFSLGVLCLIVGIVVAAVVETSYKVQALTAGAVLSFRGICIVAYIYCEWQQSENLKIRDEKWITEKKRSIGRKTPKQSGAGTY